MFLAFMTLLLAVTKATGQEQEGKLVDRLLRPNMALVNSAQGKTFVANAATIDKRASTKNFSTSEKSLGKPFTGERTFSSKEFAVRHFRIGDSTANISTRSEPAKMNTVHSTPAAQNPRMLPESDQSVATASFAGSRPFLVRGKSQKALNARDTPLTIEQVRELLNKNK